jgi:ABC-type antimicrobial peptide transport system permease subunit
MSGLIASAEEFLSRIRSMTDAAGWIQIAIAVLLLFATVYMGFLDRRGEYGLLQAMGYRNREIIALVLIETACVGVPGLAVGVPIGFVFAAFLNFVLSRAWVDIPLIVSMADVMWILVPAVTCLPLAAMPALRNLLRTDLPVLVRAKGFE